MKNQKKFKKIGYAFFGMHFYTKNYGEDLRHRRQILIEMSWNAPWNPTFVFGRNFWLKKYSMCIIYVFCLYLAYKQISDEVFYVDFNVGKNETKHTITLCVCLIEIFTEFLVVRII